jgi:hypothetical protein
MGAGALHIVCASFTISPDYHLISICHKGPSPRPLLAQSPAQALRNAFLPPHRASLNFAGPAALAADDLIVKYDQAAEAAAPSIRNHHRQPGHCRHRHPVGQTAGRHEQEYCHRRHHRARCRALPGPTRACAPRRCQDRQPVARHRPSIVPPQCNPSIVIGDGQKYLDVISKAAQTKIGFSERAADSGAPAASQCASACAATANDRCGASPAQRLSSIYKAQRASAGFMGFSRLPPDSAAKHGMVLFELAQGEGSNDGANCGQEPGQRAIELM